MNGKRELATLHRANVTGWFTMSKAAVAGWAAPKAFGAAAADPLSVVGHHRRGEGEAATDGDAVALGMAGADAATEGVGDGVGLANKSSHTQRSPE